MPLGAPDMSHSVVTADPVSDLEGIVKMMNNLLKYCELDTYAHVRILEIPKAVN